MSEATPIPPWETGYTPSSDTSEASPTPPWEMGKRAPSAVQEKTTNAPFQELVGMSRADNPHEQFLELQRLHGKGNVLWDEDTGKFHVMTPDGYVTEAGVGGLLPKIGADIAAHGPEMVGAIGSGAAGSITGIPALGILGGMAGVAAGKLGEEEYKKKIGTYAKTPEEAQSALTSAVGIQGLTDLATGGIGTLVNAAKGMDVYPTWMKDLVKKKLGVSEEAVRLRDLAREKDKAIVEAEVATNPEKLNFLERMLPGREQRIENKTRARLEAENKVAPPFPLGSFAEDVKSFISKFEVANTIHLNWPQKQAVNWAMNRLKDVLGGLGLKGDELKGAIDEIIYPQASISLAKPTKVVTEAIGEQLDAYESRVADASFHATNVLNDTGKLFKYLDKVGQDTKFGQDVSNMIKESRANFGTAMSKGYNYVNRLVGDRPVVPTIQIWRAAEPIFNAVPPANRPAFMNQLANLPEKITLADAHRMRSMFRELARSKEGLAAGINFHDMNTVAEGVDRAISSMSDITDGAAKRALDQIDREYANGIKVYNKLEMKQLVQDAKSGIFADEDQIVSTMFKQGETELAKQLMSMAPDPMKRKFADAFTRKLIQDAKQLDPVSGNMDVLPGKQLLDILNGYNPEMLDTILTPTYGKGYVAKLREYAKGLAAVDGKVSAASLKSGDMLNAIRDKTNAERLLQNFVETDPLGALHSKNPEAITKAVERLTQPGKDYEPLLEHAMKFLNEDQRKELRVYALKNLTKDIFKPTPQQTLRMEPHSFSNAWKGYTKRQQELLFPETAMYPEGVHREMELLDKYLQMYFPGGGRMAEGLAGGNVRLNVPWNINADRKWLGYMVLQKLAYNPSLQNLILGAASGSKPEQQIAEGLMSKLIRETMNPRRTMSTFAAHEMSSSQPSPETPAVPE